MEDSLKLSKGFAKVNQAKLKKNLIVEKQKEEKVQEIVKKKVSDVDANYGSWKVNKPGIKKDPKKEVRVEMKKTGRILSGKSQISPKRQPEKQQHTQRQ